MAGGVRGSIPSLRGRALRALSMREYSRIELARKLAPHAESDEQLTALLDALESERWLSNDRFAQSLVHRRTDRFGSARIKAELKSHGVAPDIVERALLDCQNTDLVRARDIWQRRFGAIATEPKERARQARFLAARGFSSAVIRRIVAGLIEDE